MHFVMTLWTLNNMITHTQLLRVEKADSLELKREEQTQMEWVRSRHTGDEVTRNVTEKDGRRADRMSSSALPCQWGSLGSGSVWFSVCCWWGPDRMTHTVETRTQTPWEAWKTTGTFPPSVTHRQNTLGFLLPDYFCSKRGGSAFKNQPQRWHFGEKQRQGMEPWRG